MTLINDEKLLRYIEREARLYALAVQVNRWAGWCRTVGWTSGLWSLVGLHECVSAMTCDPWPFRAQVAFHGVMVLGIAPIAALVIVKATKARERYDAEAQEEA